MRRRHPGFGLPYETHRTKFGELIVQGERAAILAHAFLEDGDCREAFDQLLTARDRLSRAQMHLVSAVEPEQLSPLSTALGISKGKLGDLSMRLFATTDRFSTRCLCGKKRGRR